MRPSRFSFSGICFNSPSSCILQRSYSVNLNNMSA
uniref:Uncharacterized protein n=1 Tax=Anguilla anguilla TaxID=7936 RepID=A0A0E9PEA8_ANGAN